MLPRVALGIAAAFGAAAVAYSQAAVEYALKSSGGALSGSGAPVAIGGCRVDSTFLTCLNRSYPRMTIVVIGLLTLMALWWLVKAYSPRR